MTGSPATSTRIHQSLVLAVLVSVVLTASPKGWSQEGPDHAVKGRELMAAGSYEAALPFLQRDLAAVERAVGADSPALAAPLNDLAEANRLAGHLGRAEQLYEQALALDERARSKDPIGTATTMNNLALVYRQDGRLQDAERLQAQSLRLLEQALGPNDGRIALGLHNMAAIYRDQGRPGDAKPLQERAVAVADQAFGPRSPDTQRFRAALDALGDAPATSVAVVERAVPRSPGKTALPPPPLESEPSPAPARAGGFTVQLASVRNPDDVEGEWRRLVRRYAELATLELQPAQRVEVKGKGTFYRVFGGPLSSLEEAQALCARLKTAGASCRPNGR